MTIRSATLEDADAIAAIYAPIVRGTTISFEFEPPSAGEMRARIEKTLSMLPWLVSGVCRRLYEELFRQLVELGYWQAFAGIALPNEASVGLHESMGFQQVGIYRRVGFKHGAWRDVGWWQKELQSPAAEPRPPRSIA